MVRTEHDYVEVIPGRRLKSKVYLSILRWCQATLRLHHGKKYYPQIWQFSLAQWDLWRLAYDCGGVVIMPIQIYYWIFSWNREGGGTMMPSARQRFACSYTCTLWFKLWITNTRFWDFRNLIYFTSRATSTFSLEKWGVRISFSRCLTRLGNL